MLDTRDARSVEAVGTGFPVRAEPTDRLVDVGLTHDESFGPTGQDHAAPARVDGLASCPNPIDRQLELVQRLRLIPTRVLDREPGDSGSDGRRHVDANLAGIHGETTPEVGVYGQLHRLHDGRQMLQRLIERDLVISTTQRPRKPGTRRRERREPELRQRTGAARVPRVGHDEAPRRVQAAELGDSFGLRAHVPPHAVMVS